MATMAKESFMLGTLAMASWDLRRISAVAGMCQQHGLVAVGEEAEE